MTLSSVTIFFDNTLTVKRPRSLKVVDYIPAKRRITFPQQMNTLRKINKFN
jgi:hypothetical protein